MAEKYVRMRRVMMFTVVQCVPYLTYKVESSNGTVYCESERVAKHHAKEMARMIGCMVQVVGGAVYCPEMGRTLSDTEVSCLVK